MLKERVVRLLLLYMVIGFGLRALSLVLIHEFSVGAAVSYSRDFHICINFCETIESPILLCAIGLYLKCLDRNVYQFTETCSPFVLPF